uniref:Uncharacterized protein n=1 Tax=Globisporangium ultimum (strain ATCC 200006 / CBS 805.95 / DAOM BR144) TaxID=431595 RepID=K3WF46_GLOUD
MPRFTSTKTSKQGTYQIPSLDNLSPRNNYVTIQTPGVVAGESLDNQDVYTCLTPTHEKDSAVCCENAHEDEVYVNDSNGLRMHAWSSALNERKLSASYFWFARCCPCIACSFKCGVLSYFISQATLIALWLLLGATLWSYLTGNGDSIQWTVAAIIFSIVQTVCIASRIASLRAKVRARFAIPGSLKHDLQLAAFHPTHSIFQMGKHLACDRVHPCSAPTMLPAYEV